MVEEISEKSVCIANILLLAVLLFLLLSILVPAGRNEEVGYGGMALPLLPLKKDYHVLCSVTCERNTKLAHILSKSSMLLCSAESML